MSIYIVKKHLSFVYLISMILGLFVAGYTSAQAEKIPNHEGWYQIEMIIFSRNNPDTIEHFPSNIQLKYPRLWQTLKSYPSVVDATATSKIINAEDLPFYLLPWELHQLNGNANKLMKSSSYTVLFHQAWRQIVTNKKQAEWILINNQRQNELSPLLSGSIRVSVATYLRVDANLWFAEFEPRTDLPSVSWPEIPESPDVIAQQTIADPSTMNQELSVNLTENSELESNSWQTKRIVLLKDKREMRSNETHYIDHPVFGIIVRISPIKSSPKL